MSTTYGFFKRLLGSSSSSPSSSSAAAEDEAVSTANGGIDVVFVVDTTGSMGSQIHTVQSNLRSMVTKINAVAKGAARYGLIAYKDHTGSSFVVKVHVPLTDSESKMKSGVDEMSADGGADYPEAVTDGLYELVRMSWRPNATKTAVLIADAPPHGVGGSGDSYPNGCPCGEEWLEQVESCREMGITIHTVACSGLQEIDVWKKIASETWGQYFDVGGDYSSLPTLITGVAECDFDKQHLASLVDIEATKRKKQLAAIGDEEERVGYLFDALAAKGTRTKTKKGDARAAATEEPISQTDLEQALSTLRRTGSTIVNELFPTSFYKEKGGLYENGTESPVPLKSIEANISIIGFCCEVEIVQKYQNSKANPIEATYKFPIDDLAAVCGFIAEIDNKRIIAKCMEKEKAAAKYEDAIASGHGAYLLEQKKPDIFNMSVGNLPPGKTVTIRVTYVTVLESDNGVTRFILPMTIAPRYKKPVINESTATTDRDEGPLANTVSYNFSITATVEMPSDLSTPGAIVSPTHPTIHVQAEGQRAIVKLASDAEMNADFVLLVKAPCSAQAITEIWDAPDGINLPLASIAAFEPVYDATIFNPEIMAELYLIIDCSASMYGGQIRKAKEGGLHWVSELSHCSNKTLFTVIAFGSDLKKLFDSAHPITSDTITKATRFIENLQADKGGSQFMRVLNELKSAPTTDRKKYAFIITDGAFSQESEVKTKLKEMSSFLTVFPIAVGHGVSPSVIRDMARRSGGVAEFCTLEEDIKPKVSRDFARIYTPLLRTKGAWGCATTETYPTVLPPVISGFRTTMFALLPSGVEKSPKCTKGHDCTLKDKEALMAINPGYKSGYRCDCCGGDNGFPVLNCAECQFDICPNCQGDWGHFVSLVGDHNLKPVALKTSLNLESLRKGKILHRLCARELIRKLENAEGTPNKAAIIALATTYNLASSQTSFIAVEERIESVTETMEAVEIPSQLPRREIQGPQPQQQQQQAMPTPTPSSHSTSLKCLDDIIEMKKEDRRPATKCSVSIAPIARRSSAVTTTACCAPAASLDCMDMCFSAMPTSSAMPESLPMPKLSMTRPSITPCGAPAPAPGRSCPPPSPARGGARPPPPSPATACASSSSSVSLSPVRPPEKRSSAKKEKSVRKRECEKADVVSSISVKSSNKCLMMEEATEICCTADYAERITITEDEEEEEEIMPEPIMPSNKKLEWDGFLDEVGATSAERTTAKTMDKVVKAVVKFLKGKHLSHNEATGDDGIKYVELPTMDSSVRAELVTLIQKLLTEMRS